MTFAHTGKSWSPPSFPIAHIYKWPQNRLYFRGSVSIMVGEPLGKTWFRSRVLTDHSLDWSWKASERRIQGLSRGDWVRWGVYLKGWVGFVEETSQKEPSRLSGVGTWHLVKLGLQRWDRFATSAQRNGAGSQYSGWKTISPIVDLAGVRYLGFGGQSAEHL